MHFLEWKCMNSIKISVKFVPKGSISNIPALVQIMAWRRLGDKPLSEPMLACSPMHICVSQPQWVNIPSELKSTIKEDNSLAVVSVKLPEPCLQNTPRNKDQRIGIDQILNIWLITNHFDLQVLLSGYGRSMTLKLSQMSAELCRLCKHDDIMLADWQWIRLRDDSFCHTTV